MEGVPTISIIIMILLILLWLYLLGSTAEEFFCPVLEELTDTLKLSPNLAGVTLLAFGNGAPDVFSNIAAFSSGKSTLGLSGLLGAGIFVTLAVVGAVGFVSAPQLQASAFLRDLLFYIGATVMLMYFYADEKITAYEAITFPFLYFLYVLVVILSDMPCCLRVCPCRLRHLEGLHEPLLSEDVVIDEPEPTDDLPEHPTAFEIKVTAPPQADRDLHRSGSINSDLSQEGAPAAKSPVHHTLDFTATADYMRERVETRRGFLHLDQSDYLNCKSRSRSRANSNEVSINSKSKPVDEGENNPDTLRYISGWSEYVQDKRDEAKIFWGAMGCRGRVQLVLESPFLLARMVTIPPVTADSWDRPLCGLCFLLAPLFFVWATDNAGESLGKSFPVWALSVILGPIFALAVFSTTSWNKLPPKGYKVVLLIISFSLSVVWIMLIANELVLLLGIVGDLISIPSSVLGLTVLAWGNSLGDMVANVSIAKNGHARMAIAGCFAGPMFNMLIGQGLSLVIVAFKQNGHVYSLRNGHESNDWITAISFIFLFVSLLTSLVLVSLSRFQVKKRTSIILILIYLLFTLLCILGVTNVLNMDVSDFFD